MDIKRSMFRRKGPFAVWAPRDTITGAHQRLAWRMLCFLEVFGRKTGLHVLLTAVLTATLMGCSTPEPQRAYIPTTTSTASVGACYSDTNFRCWPLSMMKGEEQ